jgi:hypothetical protein
MTMPRQRRPELFERWVGPPWQGPARASPASDVAACSEPVDLGAPAKGGRPTLDYGSSTACVTLDVLPLARRRIRWIPTAG